MKSKSKRGHKTKKNESDGNESDDYCLDRLFDPEELYYVPIRELVKRYKKRSLIPGRVYNLAKKYGYVPDSRTRVIQAPQMRRAKQRIFGNENFYEPPPKVYYCTHPNNETNARNRLNTSESENDDDDDDESKLSYEERMRNRKMLRQNLNKLDLDHEYLKRKKDLTEMEKRVLAKFLRIDKQVQTDPVVEKVSKRSKTPPPKIQYPTPGAMERIEKFLAENRWRLVDLFKDLDKNKDWRVKGNDLIREVRKGRLDISDGMVDELVAALGSKAFKINYKSLARGRSSHLSERRAQLRESRESGLSSGESSEIDDVDNSYSRSPISPDAKSPTRVNNEVKSKKKTTASSPERPSRKVSSTEVEKMIVINSIKSNNESKTSSYSSMSTKSFMSTSSTAETQHLQLPKIDLRPERYYKRVNEPTYQDRMTSARSSALNNLSRLNDEQNHVMLAASDSSQTNRKCLDRFRQNEIDKFESYVDKTRGVCTDEDAFRKGFFNPPDRDREVVLGELKARDEMKKKSLQVVKKTKKKTKSESHE